MRSPATVLILLLLTGTALAERDGSETSGAFTASLAAGFNVDTPFVEAQLGRRFATAPHFELFLDYSYGAAISEFSFQTFGAGVRTYFFHRDRVELFHEALLALGVSSSGNGPVEDRAIGERLLGAFMTQGVGAQIRLLPQLALTVNAAVGYPVWLRSSVGLRYTF